MEKRFNLNQIKDWALKLPFIGFGNFFVPFDHLANIQESFPSNFQSTFSYFRRQDITNQYILLLFKFVPNQHIKSDSSCLRTSKCKPLFFQGTCNIKTLNNIRFSLLTIFNKFLWCFAFSVNLHPVLKTLYHFFYSLKMITKNLHNLTGPTYTTLT